MQLTQKKNIAQALAIASCGLINPVVEATTDDRFFSGWDIDAALMYYGEQDRVQAIEAIGDFQKQYDDESQLNLKVVFDSLTGASASGAVAQSQHQTFTRPSGDGQYIVGAGDTPLDDSFKDTRLQLSANWIEQLSLEWQSNVGVYGSREFDYTSLGVNGGVERSLNKDNTTLAISAAYTYDLLEPVGAKPVPLSAMAIRQDFISEQAFRQAFNLTRGDDSDDKQTLDLILGLTQIINANWLMQFNYGLSSVAGYLTDPYKILSVVDSSGTSQQYRYEHRPDSRLKHSLFALAKGVVAGDIVDISYRYNSDDWDINSHTFDGHYRHYFNDDFYGQLHLRYYLQSAAEFYQPFLVMGSMLPDYASADYRIGEMTTYTFGIKFGHKLKGDHELSYRLEWYQQAPKNNGTALVGQLQQHELFPSLTAVIAQVSYSF